MRISIIGHAGIGKSTLANQISEKLHIPYLQLDRLWFEAGGHKLHSGESAEREQVREYIRQKVRDFILQDAWVSDGWYRRSQSLIAERADQIVFLDISLARRLMNHFRRIFKNVRHPELSKWDDFKFTYQIIRRTFAHGPQMREFVRGHAEKVIVLRDYEAVTRYVEQLK